MRSKGAIRGGGVIAATALAFAGTSVAALAITATTDLSVITPAQVAQTLVGPGVVISNVSYTGAERSAGTFSGGSTSVGFAEGVSLSSGNIADWVGPTNDSPDTTTDLDGLGDADLTALAGFETYDATVLEFDFTADADTVYFRYVFGSEEYNEYVNTPYNDVFAFFVNGVNCANVPDPSNPGSTLPVSINSINNGNPGGDPTSTNPALYRDNTASPNPYPTELDGLTIVLTCMAPVNVSPATNHMKLAIADASDPILDSAVFLERGSLSTTPPSGIGKVTGGGRVDLADGAVSFGTTVIQDEQGLRGKLQINDHRSGDKFHGTSVTQLNVSGKVATWSGEGRFNGEDGYTYDVTVKDNRNGNSKKRGDPDTVTAVVRDAGGTVVWEIASPENLQRGNITVH